MGFDDIAISFAISYIAGNIPDLMKLIKNTQLEDELDVCYQKALKKWTVNGHIIRDQSARMNNHLSSLVKYIQNEQLEVPLDIQELIVYWTSELRSNAICYNFINEHKLLFIGRKFDEKFQDMKDSLISQFESVKNNIKESTEEIRQSIYTLKIQIEELRTQNIKDQIPFIENILNDNIKPLIQDLKIKTALSLIHMIESAFSNVMSQKGKIAAEILSKKELCTNLIERKYKFTIRTIDIDKEVFTLPNTITLDNLNEWLSIMEAVKEHLGGSIAIDRKHALEISGYKLAYDAADQFFALFDRTEIANIFPTYRVLYYYWGFIVKNDNKFLVNFQQIDKSLFGDNLDYCTILEATMLYMNGDADDAFYKIAASRDKFNASALDLIILMGIHSLKIEYIVWGLTTAIKKQICIGEDASKFLASAINSDTAIKILNELPNLIFENEANKIIITELCNFNLGRDINISKIKETIGVISDTILAYAALLMAQNGDISLAFDILNSKIEPGKMDIKQTIFINILCMSKEYRPHFYRLLQSNRKQGVVAFNDLLIHEINLAIEVADFENALEVIKILFSKDPDNEEILANYMKLLAQVRPAELKLFQAKISSFRYKNSDNIKKIYISYAENGYLDFATEFLANQQYIMQSEDLRYFFYTQSLNGFIHKIVNKEFFVAEEGLSVLYSVKEKEDKRTILLDSSTPLGNAFWGKKKGDIIVFKDEEYIIEGIFSKYFKMNASYMSDAINTGGNKYMQLFRLDKNNILESFDSIISEIAPDASGYEAANLQQYENNELGLIQIINHSNPVNSYYKYLFTSFNIYISPYSVYRNENILAESPHIRPVLDLPACIMFFEFALKYSITYKTRFILPKYLYELIKRTKKYVQYDMEFEMIDAVIGGCLTRLDQDPVRDCDIRLMKLIEWIENSCDIEIFSEV